MNGVTYLWGERPGHTERFFFEVIRIATFPPKQETRKAPQENPDVKAKMVSGTFFIAQFGLDEFGQLLYQDVFTPIYNVRP